jgi:hypothetical protein
LVEDGCSHGGGEETG